MRVMPVFMILLVSLIDVKIENRNSSLGRRAKIRIINHSTKFARSSCHQRGILPQHILAGAWALYLPSIDGVERFHGGTAPSAAAANSRVRTSRRRLNKTFPWHARFLGNVSAGMSRRNSDGFVSTGCSMTSSLYLKVGKHSNFWIT